MSTGKEKEAKKTKKIKLDPTSGTAAEEVVEKVDLTKLSDKEIEEEVEKISTEAEKVGKELAEKKYAVDLDGPAGLNKLIKACENHVKWTHKEVPQLIQMYTNLKHCKVDGVDKDGKYGLIGSDVAGVYNAMLKMEGLGFHSAKAHLALITLIGEGVSNAMKEITDDNQILRDVHTRLSDIDSEQAARQTGIEVAPEVKTVKTDKTDESK